MKAHEDFVPWTELAPILVEMRHAATLNHEPVMRAILLRLVHGYRPHRDCGTGEPAQTPVVLPKDA